MWGLVETGGSISLTALARIAAHQAFSSRQDPLPEEPHPRRGREEAQAHR